MTLWPKRKFVPVGIPAITAGQLPFYLTSPFLLLLGFIVHVHPTLSYLRAFPQRPNNFQQKLAFLTVCPRKGQHSSASSQLSNFQLYHFIFPRVTVKKIIELLILKYLKNIFFLNFYTGRNHLDCNIINYGPLEENSFLRLFSTDQ